MRTFPGALHPTHSRPSLLEMAVRSPISGEGRNPYVPAGTPCDVIRMDVEATYDSDPDNLVYIGLFNPRASVFPTREGFRGSVPGDRDRAGQGIGTVYLDCGRACLGAGRLGSGADTEPVPSSSAGVENFLPVRIPRHERDFEHLEPRGSDACWPHRRGGGDQSDLSCAPGSQFIGFVGCGVDAGVARANASCESPQGQPPNSAELLPGCTFSDHRALVTDKCQRAILSLKPNTDGRLTTCQRMNEVTFASMRVMARLRVKSRQQEKVSAHAPGN